MAPQIVRKSEAAVYITRWIVEKGGVENTAKVGCFCGQYRLRADDDRCTTPEHCSEQVAFRCGVFATRRTDEDVPYLCNKSDRNVTYTIEEYVVEGLCPQCPHSSQDYQKDMIRQHTRRQSEDWKHNDTDDESQEKYAIEQLRHDLSQGWIRIPKTSSNTMALTLEILPSLKQGGLFSP
ncbi:hypothetical protein F5B18DRAFT_668328 [Nemania serpens]|nr:hypothetical protein F5B18DRAFT_668328 [Nemania serpens]